MSALAGRLDEFADTWQVLQITGPGKASAGAAGRVHTVMLDYCDCMDLALAAADLALARAGAVSIAELLASGTPAVLLPYPHAGGHQQLNADQSARAGAAKVIVDSGDALANAAALSPVLTQLMAGQSELADMSSLAKGLAKVGAAAEVASWLAGRG